jgi:hypothetical protein
MRLAPEQVGLIRGGRRRTPGLRREEVAQLAHQVGPALRRVLDALNPLPAYVIGRHWNFLAWNTTAEQVLLLSKPVPPYDYNAIWRLFASPMRQQLYHPTWEQVAQKVLAEFRAESAQYADEQWFKCLIADLQRVSPEFRAWWPRHDVRGRVDARKDVVHPVVGCLMFEQTTLQVPTQPELKIMIYTPLPETDTLEKLQQLNA